MSVLYPSLTINYIVAALANPLEGKQSKLNVNLNEARQRLRERVPVASIIFNWNISWQISIYCSLTRVVCSNICQCCHCQELGTAVYMCFWFFFLRTHDTFINYLNLIINWSGHSLLYVYVSLGETSGRIYGISKTTERYAATYHRIFRASLSGQILWRGCHSGRAKWEVARRCYQLQLQVIIYLINYACCAVCCVVSHNLNKHAGKTPKTLVSCFVSVSLTKKEIYRQTEL